MWFQLDLNSVYRIHISKNHGLFFAECMSSVSCMCHQSRFKETVSVSSMGEFKKWIKNGVPASREEGRGKKTKRVGTRSAVWRKSLTFTTRRRCAMRTCLLCSNILPRYPHFLPSFLFFWFYFLFVTRSSLARRRCATRRREAWTRRILTGRGSPCRSWGTSSTRGTSSSPKSSCCRRSWPTTKGTDRHTYFTLRRPYGSVIVGAFLIILTVCFCSDETEEIVTPSPSPSPELRSRSRSSAQPESGIKRLYVAPLMKTLIWHDLTHSSFFSLSRFTG